MAAAIWSQKDMRSPSGGEARHRGGTQVGKAPPSPEMTISGLTESGLSGKIILPKLIHSPALPDVRPAPQAGCFVARLKLSKDSAQITLRHRAFRTVALASSRDCWSLSVKRATVSLSRVLQVRRISRAADILEPWEPPVRPTAVPRY